MAIILLKKKWMKKFFIVLLKMSIRLAILLSSDSEFLSLGAYKQKALLPILLLGAIEKAKWWWN